MTRSFLPTGLMAVMAIGSLGLETGYSQQAKVKPLISDLFTADPSAHVFNGKIYIYPSHDVEANVPQDDEGGHFNMRDYHVYSMDAIGGKVTDHGVALDLKNIPWARPAAVGAGCGIQEWYLLFVFSCQR
jgi:hypothetical protein